MNRDQQISKLKRSRNLSLIVGVITGISAAACMVVSALNYDHS